MDFCNPETSGSLNQHWQYFIDTGDSHISEVRGVILRSWQRCLASGVDPFDSGLHCHLQGDDLSLALTGRESLIAVAHPFMSDLYAIVRGSGFVVVLTNEDGYILELFSDEGAEQTPMTSNFFIGASWLEKNAGTNAIGTAIEEQKPVQVSGPEHYCRKHHFLTCSAAPVFDPDERLIGVLDISGDYKKAHLHTLGMVVAAAKAITAQMRIRLKNFQLAVANHKLSSFFNMVSDGVMILNHEGLISELNPAAERIFGLPRAELKDRKFTSLLMDDSSENNGGFKWEESHTDIETLLNTSSGQCQCLASAEPIRDERDSLKGSFVTLRPIKAVQHLVHRISGYSASLQFGDIVGQSREMKEAIELARLSAQTASNVLLQGESGTGKEIFAQAIHNQSSRRAAPFIPLNCGAIPRDLVGSELFGYEGGAFTGASRGGKPGKFELADGGTLFLDEIGDMPLEQQAVLLRVIQEKRMTRIGGIKVIPVDVRLICATHKNLLERVRKGTFRQDLYYRLNVMSITIPPLRERLDDIPLLFRHFLDKICRDSGRSLTVDRDLMHYLYAYPWPGNVRELQNVVERTSNLAINGVVSVHQLPGEITHRAGKTAVPAAVVRPVGRRQLLLLKKEREKRQLIQLLNVHDGNITQVARELGVSRKTIYNRMQRYGIVN